MALNETSVWLIAYDICHPRRLARVHRYIQTVAAPAQYSLYVASETALGIRRIRDELADRINPREDDVRIYKLPARTRIVHYGRRPMPEGLQLLCEDPVKSAWKAITG